MFKLIFEYLSVGVQLVMGVLFLTATLGEWALRILGAGAKVLNTTQDAAKRAQNWATLKGRVVATGELFRAPFTGCECVMYEAEILRIGGKPIVDRKVSNIIVENDSGRVLAYGTDIVIEKKFDLLLDDPDPKYKAVLANYGIDYHDWQVYKVVRCQERYVVPGQEIELSGCFEYIDADPRIIRPVSGTRVAVNTL